MRPLKRTEQAPVCLQEYTTQNPDATWKHFRDENRDCLRQVYAALIRMQHDLCAYCERDVTETDKEVEHFFPRDKAAEYPQGNAHLDWPNMLLCCKGGGLADTEKRYQEGRVQRPPGQTCGLAKDNALFDETLNPYNWTMPLMEVQPVPLGVGYDYEGQQHYDARLVPIALHCEQCSVPKEKIEKFIDVLHLNAPHLLMQRGALYSQLLVFLQAVPEEKREAVARHYLLPDASGRLQCFVSTALVAFGKYGNRIMSENN